MNDPFISSFLDTITYSNCFSSLYTLVMYYFITCLSVYENTFDLGDKNHIFFLEKFLETCV